MNRLREDNQILIYSITLIVCYAIVGLLCGCSEAPEPIKTLDVVLSCSECHTIIEVNNDKALNTNVVGYHQWSTEYSNPIKVNVFLESNTTENMSITINKERFILYGNNISIVRNYE